MRTCSRPNTGARSLRIPFTAICQRCVCGGPALTAFFLFEIRPHWPSAATDYPALEKVLSGRCRWFPAPLARNLLLSADTLPHEKARLSPLPTQSVHILRLFTFFAPLDRGPILARGRGC